MKDETVLKFLYFALWLGGLLIVYHYISFEAAVLLGLAQIIGLLRQV